MTIALMSNKELGRPSSVLHIINPMLVDKNKPKFRF
jgi:hypothetical protein